MKGSNSMSIDFENNVFSALDDNELEEVTGGLYTDFIYPGTCPKALQYTWVRKDGTKSTYFGKYRDRKKINGAPFYLFFPQGGPKGGVWIPQDNIFERLF